MMPLMVPAQPIFILNTGRISAYISHISNTGFDSNNPGNEVIGLYWDYPAGEMF
ncbi:MAG: acyloxyacyl hydrolase [Alphaproteobacteria bacterium]